MKTRINVDFGPARSRLGQLTAAIDETAQRLEDVSREGRSRLEQVQTLTGGLTALASETAACASATASLVPPLRAGARAARRRRRGRERQLLVGLARSWRRRLGRFTGRVLGISRDGRR